MVRERNVSCNYYLLFTETELVKTRQEVGVDGPYLFHVPLNMITLYTVRSQDFQEILQSTGRHLYCRYNNRPPSGEILTNTNQEAGQDQYNYQTDIPGVMNSSAGEITL